MKAETAARTLIDVEDVAIGRQQEELVGELLEERFETNNGHIFG